MKQLLVEFGELEVSVDENDNGRGKDYIELNMVFPDLTFTEIKQRQAYDVKKLIGDVGGYIGLLLGYALLGMPGFVRKIYEFLRILRDYREKFLYGYQRRDGKIDSAI